MNLWLLQKINEFGERLKENGKTGRVKASRCKFYRRPVSSVGRASDYHAGGREFEPQTGPTLRVLK